MDAELNDLEALLLEAVPDFELVPAEHSPVSVSMDTGDTTELVEDILDRTHEGNRDLIERTVHATSYTVCKTALARTLEIQAKGGIFVSDGSRRRSAGGVFMELVIEAVGKEVLKPVYAENRKVVKELQRAARQAVQKRKQMQNNQQQKRRRMSATER
jgi:phosphorylated adapter RNA export protein